MLYKDHHSSKIINKVFPLANKLNFMQIESFKFNNENILISRSGYTGEDGFELSIPNTQIKNIIEKLSNHNDTYILWIRLQRFIKIGGRFMSIWK